MNPPNHARTRCAHGAPVCVRAPLSPAPRSAAPWWTGLVAALALAGCLETPEAGTSDGATGSQADGSSGAGGRDDAGPTNDGGAAGAGAGAGGGAGGSAGKGGEGGAGAEGGAGGSAGEGGDGGAGAEGGAGGSAGEGGAGGAAGAGAGAEGGAGGSAGEGGAGGAAGAGAEGGSGGDGGSGGTAGAGAEGGTGGSAGAGAEGGTGGSAGEGGDGGAAGAGAEGGEGGGGVDLVVECLAGAVDTRACGLILDGTMARRCSPQGRWSAFGPCVEPEPCADGALEVRACGADGLGLQSRLCTEARWQNTSVCVFPVRCTEATEGVCSRPVGEVCNGLDDDADGAVDEGLAGPTAIRPATTFDLAVAQTVARGIERIRWQEAQGRYRVGDAEDNAAWAALAVMAQRDRDGLGAPLGYGRLSAADQALVRRLMTIALQRMPVSLSGQDYAEFVERLSPAVLALSTYVPTGGPALPIERLEGLTIEQVWRNAVAQLLRQQADARWPQSQGGWGRVNPGLHADFDMTHLAGCALASAAPVMPEVEAAFAAVQPLLTLHQVLDGGYRSLQEQRSGTSATAGGHWLAARSGLAPNQRRRAAALAWLADHHAPDAVIDPIQLRTAYLSKWSIYHSLAGAGGMHDPRFATRVPATPPWPDATPGVHFDLALSLLGWQSPEGHIGGGELGSPVGQSYQHDHLISLLFLSRHTCEPALPLPDLAGAPHCNDGIDNDGDGLIDAADPECRFTCTLRESPVPACSNGLDDDGDGRIDHQEDPGCSGPEGEVEDPECDNGLDDDGDGQIDWGAIGVDSDAHCDSAADRCEAADTTWCGDACVYLATDEDHCGRCGRPCNPGVACEDGVCMEGPGLLPGIQQNAADPSLAGWRECHRGPFAVQLPLADLRNDCQGQYIAMGCRNVGSPTWALVAMGQAAAIWTDTHPPEGAAPHLHNGATWFFSGSGSEGNGAMGFGAPGTTLRAGGRCGGEVSDPEQFMCWNTTNGNLIEGHRCGERFGGAALNRYERAVWVYP